MKLDDLTALNDEIGALARAGVPIGKGLLEMGRDMPRQIGGAAQLIGKRLEQGQSIDEVLADESLDIPAAYRAVVTTGVRTGHLPVAVEKLAGTLRRIAEVRNMLKVASIYPIALVIIACCLFGFLIRPIHRTLYDLLVDEDLATGWLPKFLYVIATYGHWLILIAAILCILVWIWWVAAAFVSDKSWLGRSAGRFPGVTQMRRIGSRAAFADVLAMLVEQQMPLTEAIPLAASTCGDDNIRADADRLSKHIGQGGAQRDRWEPSKHGIPPMLAWQLTNATQGDNLQTGLRRLANHYSQEVENMNYWLQRELPVWLVGVLGGGIVVAYALGSIVPWFVTMGRLSEMAM